MGIKDIVLYPEKEIKLRQKSQPVRKLNRRIKNLIQDLKDTLLDHPEGVGLAAIQIDVPLRIFVVRLGAKEEGNDEAGPPIAFVNAEILEEKNEETGFDGCLSLPGLFGNTIRPKWLRIKARDENGKWFEQTYEGFDAVVIHHEIDHTDGVLFLDRIATPDDLFTVREDEEGNLIRVPFKVR